MATQIFFNGTPFNAGDPARQLTVGQPVTVKVELTAPDSHIGDDYDVVPTGGGIIFNQVTLPELAAPAGAVHQGEVTFVAPTGFTADGPADLNLRWENPATGPELIGIISVAVAAAAAPVARPPAGAAPVAQPPVVPAPGAQPPAAGVAPGAQPPAGMAPAGLVVGPNGVWHFNAPPGHHFHFEAGDQPVGPNRPPAAGNNRPWWFLWATMVFVAVLLASGTAFVKFVIYDSVTAGAKSHAAGVNPSFILAPAPTPSAGSGTVITTTVSPICADGSVPTPRTVCADSSTPSGTPLVCADSSAPILALLCANGSAPTP